MSYTLKWGVKYKCFTPFEVLMDKIYETGLLLDFYGQLLTKRQREILDLNINSDYSLGEIAEQLNISRQGVFDNIKRAKLLLLEFEEKLELVSRFSAQKKKAEDILDLIKKIDKKDISKNHSDILTNIEEDVSELISEMQ